jgi:hypothetical protein
MTFADLTVGERFTHRGTVFVKEEFANARGKDGREFIFNSDAEVERILELAHKPASILMPQLLGPLGGTRSHLSFEI